MPDVTDLDRSTPPVSASHEALMFPTLTPAQIHRIAAHGVARPIARGDVLIEAGDPIVPFFVVKSGEIEIIRPSNPGDVLVAIHGPGRFTGEGNLILGRRSLTRARVSQTGEAIELTRSQMLTLVQTDAEISEILLRAFIYRRLELVALGIGDVVVIGSMHLAATLRIKDLTRDDLATAQWPLARPPHLLETSLPGVFAVGDVRSGNVKRVASAVGEGSIAVSFVHRAVVE